MQSIKTVLMVALATASLTACVVAPPAARTIVVSPPVVRPVYVAPPGVVYVEPGYAVPAQGYVWAYHANRGWGWHHPRYGWHLGWR